MKTVYAPALGAFAVIISKTGLKGLRQFIKRIFLWRCSLSWYLFLLVGIPLIFYGGKAVQGQYLSELLTGVSIDMESDETQYGAGVVIYPNDPQGNVYGHSGWISGYCSSLRYYPDYGIAVAFQVNTDIGIMDTPDSVMKEMEACLAGVVVNHLNIKSCTFSHFF